MSDVRLPYTKPVDAESRFGLVLCNRAENFFLTLSSVVQRQTSDFRLPTSDFRRHSPQPPPPGVSIVSTSPAAALMLILPAKV